MGKTSTNNIRNVVLLSHSHAGKTSLAEALLYGAGASDRLGKVADGTTLLDFDPEEIKRQITINTVTSPYIYKDYKINLIDTPGYFDFAGEVFEGISAADGALIVISANSGVSVGTELSFERAKAANLPIIVFINKMDDENADYHKVIEELKDKFGHGIAPFRVPIRESGHLTGYVNIITMKAYKYGGNDDTEISIPDFLADEVASCRDALCEAVAETSEELMEKYFAGEEFNEEEMRGALKTGVKDGSVVPVYSGSALTNTGVRFLSNAFVNYFPSPAGKVSGTNKSGSPIEFDVSENAPFSAQVFKTIADPYVGKMSLIRVYSGTLTPDASLYNSTRDANEKAGKLYTLLGKKQIEVSSLIAGDIGVLNKLSVTTTGDTLCTAANSIKYEAIKFDRPVLQMAIVPKSKGDDEKVSSGLRRLMEEDPTFTIENRSETHQMVISGMGDQHLDIIISKLKAKFGVDVTLIPAKVPYRETIRKKVKVQGRHKKQSGGHGQFGDVWIEFEPGEAEGLNFEEKVFGGAVPKNFFPAVEKGLQECILEGILAGYPVVHLKATLVDGSYHPVDSSEMSFKMAATIAYKEGMKLASPVLLEPIGRLNVTIPDQYLGDVFGDVNKRRGRVIGTNPAESKGKTVVEADVPMSEMSSYATDLRSMTQARGYFTFDFLCYEQAPDTVAQKVIAESKAAQQ
ncbi:MAG: elongation factor G [Bacillota bacterium]|nr:elongation factor G [Bacillota bacterium]